MDYGLATFDGAHFAHIAARQEHERLCRLREAGRLAFQRLRRTHGTR